MALLSWLQWEMKVSLKETDYKIRNKKSMKVVWSMKVWKPTKKRKHDKLVSQNSELKFLRVQLWDSDTEFQTHYVNTKNDLLTKTVTSV